MIHSRYPKSLLSAIALSALSFAPPLVAYAESPALFSAYNDESAQTVDTAPYSELITALSVTERGRTLVAYDVAHARALPFFKSYVDYLSAIPVETLNRNEQLAYWLNTRNVLLLQALSEPRRVSSYKRKRGTPSEPGSFWTEERITVSGEPLSLQDIEENILFAGWDDPNIIFGLYQGTKGGPALPRQAFTGDMVHDQLAEAGRRFTTLPSNLRVRGNTVRITSYFDWYLPIAFDGDEEALRDHLSAFVKPDQVDLVRADGKLTRRSKSNEFEQYKTRQANAGSGGARPSRSGGGGFGS